MKRLATVLMLLLLFTGTGYAAAPLNGDYQSSDLGGPLLLGRYTEAWDGSGSALSPWTTLNAESWDGAALGTQWRYWCSTSETDGVLLTDNVNASGNGNRTYMKTFVGGYIWLSGSGPWANGDPEYTGYIDTYTEFETITYTNWVPIAAITNVQAIAYFDNYPGTCMSFYIGNGTLIASTDLGQAIPADYPALLDAGCNATRTEGAAWDFCSLTLSIVDCAVGTEESSWGGIKSLHGN
jgi:hypothetical protein